jgi:hypothetical protein
MLIAVFLIRAAMVSGAARTFEEIERREVTTSKPLQALGTMSLRQSAKSTTREMAIKAEMKKKGVKTAVAAAKERMKQAVAAVLSCKLCP